MLNQKTVNRKVIIDGIGLHSGKNVKMRILPALPNSGIQFKRIDITNNNIIIPSVFNVTNATLCTTISNEYGVKVHTIEHLMAALFGLGIDNAMIEIDNSELPILDGSAKVFIENKFDSVQDYIKDNILKKYDAIDVNIYPQNIFHTKMMLKKLNLNNYLFGKKSKDLTSEKQKELLKNLKREMREIYFGQNIYD